MKLLESVFFILGIMVFSYIMMYQPSRYNPKTIQAQGYVKLALIQVPVPFESISEGQVIEYLVRCQMTKGVLECLEAQ